MLSGLGLLFRAAIPIKQDIRSINDFRRLTPRAAIVESLKSLSFQNRVIPPPCPTAARRNHNDFRSPKILVKVDFVSSSFSSQAFSLLTSLNLPFVPLKANPKYPSYGKYVR